MIRASSADAECGATAWPSRTDKTTPLDAPATITGSPRFCHADGQLGGRVAPSERAQWDTAQAFALNVPSGVRPRRVARYDRFHGFTRARNFVLGATRGTFHRAELRERHKALIMQREEPFASKPVVADPLS